MSKKNPEPDWTFWIIRYQVRGAAQSKKLWYWTETGNLAEEEARQFYDTWCKEHKKGLDNGNRRNFQLIRREEYVVEEPKPDEYVGKVDGSE